MSVVTGQTWAVEYDNADATATFASLKMVQSANRRTTAIHIFNVADQTIAKSLYDWLKDAKEIPFKIGTQHGSSAKYYHAPIFAVRHDSFSDGLPTVEVHTTDLSVSKLLLESRRIAIKTDGSMTSALKKVCDKAGVSLDIKAVANPIIEFKSLYQPGCSDWDFITRYVLPRMPYAPALCPTDGKKMLIADINKATDDVVSFPAELSAMRREITMNLENHVSGGGPYNSYRSNAITGEILDIGSGIEPRARQIHTQRFTDPASTRQVLSGINKVKNNSVVTVIECNGAVNEGKLISPGSTFKGEGFDVEGFLYEVTHTIEGGVYALSMQVRKRDG